MKIIITGAICALLCSPAMAQSNCNSYSSYSSYNDCSTNSYGNTRNQYRTDNFSGFGLNAGQGRRVTDRANEYNRRLTQDDFSGMGLNAGQGRRAAERANRRRNNW